MSHILLDTGPLVALLNQRDRHHEWTRAQWARIKPPMQTCELVLSEACFLLSKYADGATVLELVRRGVIQLTFEMSGHMDSIAKLMKKYADVPMSLADACLVRMSELDEQGAIMTFDRDFKTYRRNGRQVIPLLSPWQE